MFAAFYLAITQLGDRKILSVLAKSVAVTLLVYAVLGCAGWYCILYALPKLLPIQQSELLGLFAAVLLIAGLLLLWRIIAVAVMQFYADDVVAAVEARNYPACLAQVRIPTWREELHYALGSIGRALSVNLIALPFALVLLITGIGTPLLFWGVNAVLLGREFDQMVWRRHNGSPGLPSPLLRRERWMLGGVIAALLIVPFINLLAPFIGAAAATHLHHRKGTLPYAD